MPTRWAAWLTEPWVFFVFFFWEFYLLPGSGGAHAFSPSTVEEEAGRCLWAQGQSDLQSKSWDSYKEKPCIPVASLPFTVTARGPSVSSKHVYLLSYLNSQEQSCFKAATDNVAHMTDRKSVSSLQWQLSHFLAMPGQGMFQTHFTRQLNKIKWTTGLHSSQQSRLGLSAHSTHSWWMSYNKHSKQHRMPPKEHGKLFTKFPLEMLKTSFLTYMC